MSYSIREISKGIYESKKAKAEYKEGLYFLRNGLDLMTWTKKSTKPISNFRFSSEEKLNDYISRITSFYAKKEIEKSSRLASRKITPEKLSSLNIGDIFVSSWGYEQTNVDFYQIIEIKKSQASIKKLSKSISEALGSMSGYVTAIKDHFLNDEIINKRILFDGNNPYFKFDHTTASRWDGREQYQSWYA